MMFILGKLLTYFLSPLLWIVIVFLWGLLTKKELRRKRCYLAGILMLLFFTNPFIINKLILSYQTKKYTVRNNENYSAGILLGGFSGMNEADKQAYFNEQCDRFLQAAELYKTGHIKKIIIAAGDGSILQKQVFREADFAYQQLINLGIPAADLAADRESRNTAENAINSKKIIDSLKLRPPYLLITSAIHMPRAKKVFARASIEVVPFPSAFKIKPFDGINPEDYIIPSPTAFSNWNIYLREIIGSVAYRLNGKG